MHGWGDNCLDAKMIEFSWTLTIPDSNGLPTSFSFDLVAGSSPLIIGLDTKQYANTINLESHPYIEFRRPTDNNPRRFPTYITRSESDSRLRMEIAPHASSSMPSLMANIHGRKELSLAKKIHRYTHATATEMKHIYHTANQLTEPLAQAFDKVYTACEICCSEGRPFHAKKISISHVNEAFNQELQADFFWITIQTQKAIVLNMVDAGTRYAERIIASARNAETMTSLIDQHWFDRHGAPAAFSSDPEFQAPILTKFLQRHKINIRKRPSRRHNKTGIVERNNGVFKAIFYRLAKEQSTASASALVSRASFLSNLFVGSNTLSAFQLARGYTPSVLGLPPTIVTQDILDAHCEQVALRAIQKLLRSRNNHTIPANILKPGTDVFVFYNTSSHSVRTEWIRAKVVEAKRDQVLCRRSNHGRAMGVAYEDIRIAPKGQLTEELLSRSLEDELDEFPPDRASVVPTVQVNTTPTRLPDAPPPPPPTNITTAYHPALLATHSLGDPVKDIGSVSVKYGQPLKEDLTSDRQKVLEEIHARLGNAQVSRGKLEFAPPWILDEAFRNEHDSNWSDAYIEQAESQVPLNANVITSHVIYKVKTDEEGLRNMKARIVPHGNRDFEKDNIRKDSSTAQFAVIRLLLCLSTFLGFRLGHADVKGAYLQSGPITRDVYVRPPKEWQGNRCLLWKLTKLPYGIVEAGRQWQKTFEEWLLNDGEVERIFGISQLYRLRNAEGQTILLIAKVTDDLLMAGSIANMKAFTDKLQRRFNISKIRNNEPINFNGCAISQSNTGDILLSMQSFAKGINRIPLSRSRRKQQNELATPRETTLYKGLAGGLVWLGSGAIPQASFVASNMQQKLGCLKVCHLHEANNMLREILSLTPSILFRSPLGHVIIAQVHTFSDAAFNICKAQHYGQTGMIVGIFFETATQKQLFHLIDWTSHKQRRVSHSSYGAEILACADSDDRGYHLRSSIRSFDPAGNIQHVLHVDSRGLYDTITTLHAGKEYRLRQTVERIRNSFESKDLDILRWIPGTANIADALTKRNIKMHRSLNLVATTGHLNIDLESGYELDSETWV